MYIRLPDFNPKSLKKGNCDIGANVLGINGENFPEKNFRITFLASVDVF